MRFQSSRVIGALMVREMITRYGRSWGGYIWAILEPAAVIGVLSLAFSQVIRTPAIGESFILFYATGYIPFQFFLELSINTGGAVQFNRQLMMISLVTPLDAIFARALLSLLTLLVVATVVFATILMIVDEQVRILLDSILLAIAGGAMLGLGVGTLNAVVFEVLPFWRQVWGIISRPLFLISGVFFTFESLPEHLRDLLWWNPLIHVVGAARRGFYPNYDAAYVVMLYPFGLGFGLFVLGAALLIRNRNRIIEAR